MSRYGGLDILAAGRLCRRLFIRLIPMALESFDVGELDEAGNVVGLVIWEQRALRCFQMPSVLDLYMRLMAT